MAAAEPRSEPDELVAVLEGELASARREIARLHADREHARDAVLGAHAAITPYLDRLASSSL